MKYFFSGEYRIRCHHLLCMCFEILCFQLHCDDPSCKLSSFHTFADLVTQSFKGLKYVLIIIDIVVERRLFTDRLTHPVDTQFICPDAARLLVKRRSPLAEFTCQIELGPPVEVCTVKYFQ